MMYEQIIFIFLFSGLVFALRKKLNTFFLPFSLIILISFVFSLGPEKALLNNSDALLSKNNNEIVSQEEA